MHQLDLILMLAGGLAAAGVLGYWTHRFGLSPIVGYLLGGIVVGPHTPGFVANRSLAEQSAEVGIILLMFGVGLQFHVKELLAVRRVAIPGAIGQSLVATFLGCLLARGLGWSWSGGLFFGLAISVASTVVLLRVLADNNSLHTVAGHIAVGWLVVEDLLTVLALVLLPVLFGPEAAGLGGALSSTLLAGLKLVLLVAFVYYGGGWLLPWILGRVAATRSQELFTLWVLVIALGIAVCAAKLFGVSMALGAFLAGLVVGQSDFSSRAAAEALPMRSAFAVLFFVSVGMLFDPKFLVESPGLVCATLGIVIVGKPLSALFIVLRLGYPLGAALSVASALAQIGEFSFILASLGRELGVLGEDAMNALVAAALVSISVNPLASRSLASVQGWLERHPALLSWLGAVRPNLPQIADADSSKEGPPPRSSAVVVGHGPIGSIVTRILRENDIEPIVVELNLETVQALRARGLRAVYGDATHRATLEEAGCRTADAFILTFSGTSGSDLAIATAREINPRLRVYARAAFLREAPTLRSAGADFVFAAEAEVGLAMAESLLELLGATPEQVQRERDRARKELLGGPPEARPPRVQGSATAAGSAGEPEGDPGPGPASGLPAESAHDDLPGGGGAT